MGISVAHRDGTVETRAATDPFVWELDQLQYDLGEGPCLYSMAHEQTTVVEHARHEQRWPRFISEAVKRVFARSSPSSCTSTTGPWRA